MLVVRKELLTERFQRCRGGTVSFVSPERRYLQALERREEGGLPIVETVRAGLAFALKEKVGAGRIGRRTVPRPGGVLGALL